MMIRIIAGLSVIVWAVATVRVWQDDHNPYTTMVCIILTIASIATTIKPELITWENEEEERTK